MSDLRKLETLREDAVRALAWSIGAPGLMERVDGLQIPTPAEHERALDTAWPWLRALDEEPAPLHDYLASHGSWKVGFYFESLLAWWLQWNPELELLAHNLQVRASGRTLGALDYVVRDSEGAVQHWEVAVKFYLQRESKAEWSAWVGPNQRDRLDLKLERMRDHQLPLSSTAEARVQLANLGTTAHVQRRAVIKGALFERWRGVPVLPRGASRSTPLGVWFPASAFSEYAARTPCSRWCQRLKPDWLGPARRSAASSLSGADVLRQFRAHPVTRPQLWSRLREGADMEWHEDARVFMVPDAWGVPA